MNDKKQMQDDAMDAMRTGEKGYFWMDDDVKSAKKKSIYLVLTPDDKIILFKYEMEGIPYDNFAFKDPRTREATKVPPKGTILLVKMKFSKQWVIAFSLGKTRAGKIAACENSGLRDPDYWDEWRLPELLEDVISRRI